MNEKANQVTAANAGERVQFRFAVDIQRPGMAEFTLGQHGSTIKKHV